MGANKSTLDTHGTERTIQEDLCARCRDGAHPNEHSPRLVLITHPLVSSQALARAMVTSMQSNLLVQSSGVSHSNEALADQLFMHLLHEADIMQRRLADEPNWDALVGGVVSARIAERIEQLTARLTLVDKGAVFTDAHTYVSQLRRLPADMARAIAQARDEQYIKTVDHRPNGEHHPEWYIDTARAALPTKTVVRMVPPSYRQEEHHRHVSLLNCDRFFVSGAAPATVPQIEVFAHSSLSDEAMARVLSRDALHQGMCSALQRAETALEMQMYTPTNTLYVVIDLSAEYMRWAIAATFQHLARTYAENFTNDTLLFMVTYLVTTINNTWTQTMAEIGAHHEECPRVLTIHFDDVPNLGAAKTDGAPSEFFRDYWLDKCSPIVVSAALFFLHDTVLRLGRTNSMTQRVHGEPEGALTREATITCTEGRTRIDIKAHATDCALAFSKHSDQFRELFACCYNESEYATKFDARVDTDMMIPDRRGYDDIADGVLLLRAESQSPCPELMTGQ